MSKRMTAIAATALVLALGCEEGYGEEAEENEIIGQEEGVRETEQEEGVFEREQYGAREEAEGEGLDTAFDQGPGAPAQDPQARTRGQQQGQTAQQEQMRQEQMRQEQMRQEQMRQQQMGQQGQMGQQRQLGQQGMAQSPGQVVTTPSERNFDQTIAQLQRQMRQNDLELIGQVRYDERMRQRAMREGQQAQEGQRAMREGQRGQQAQGETELGNVRLLVFRRPNVEAMTIESMGPEALLDAPREVLVYERGDQVIVAYRAPQQAAAIGEQEPTGELLSRVVRDATSRQPTAQRERERREQRAEAGQRAQEPVDVRLVEEQERADLDVNIVEEEERADLGVRITEDERQARAQRQQREEAQN